jgi:hypothetical protein
VQEVPLPQHPLFALDPRDALPRQHEEVLLRRLGVAEATRLPGLEHRERDPELAESLRLEVGSPAQHRHVRLEHAAGAEGVVRQPGRFVGVDDEPSRLDRCEPRADVFEPRLYRNFRTPA